MRVKIFKHTFVPREAMQLQPLLSTAASSLRPTASSRSVYKDQQRESSDQEPKQMGRRSWSEGNLIGKFFVERNLMMMMPVPFLMVPSPDTIKHSGVLSNFYYWLAPHQVGLPPLLFEHTTIKQAGRFGNTMYQLFFLNYENMFTWLVDLFQSRPWRRRRAERKSGGVV